MILSNLILQLAIFISVSSQIFRCNFDEECPSLYACFNALCQLKSLFQSCTSSSNCGAGCCSGGYCRDSTQLICSFPNSCISNNDCLSLCCSNYKCQLGSICGNLQEGGSCTDSKQCASQCCYKNRCDPVIDVTICSLENIETSIIHNNVFLILLAGFDVILLFIIKVLINMYNSKSLVIRAAKEEIGKNENKDINRKSENNENNEASNSERNKEKLKENVIQNRQIDNPFKMPKEKQILLPKVQVINPSTEQISLTDFNKSIPILKYGEDNILLNSTSSISDNSIHESKNSSVISQNN